ncbi:ABATE domain-containing protein [Catenulispora sp. NF23]|uniref:ABATE domain-containing protein n=1 Tax=Catenulispora pinistramenti TaxID=2705254 RepID=A0ABS5L2F3_9ACTN|nr:ABATE domain-containing protein [Catenulispora pinistramenti]MBS2532745.1 ABATE domain-containing protein [Catenulispora pinistramenti]MBS2552508.1 ABATE domain-containing protein [Catenulispora pinistramenti]
MAEEIRRVFRMDNEVLAFRFTATVSDRASLAPRERLTDPARLETWLRATGLEVAEASPADLKKAVGLREAIYRIGSAIAAGEQPDSKAVRILNTVAAAGHAKPALEHGLAGWHLTKSTAADDALGVLAADAIHILGGPDRNHIKNCEGPGCAGLFLDTSRGANRRWCSMNTCGNKVKKMRFAEP